MARVCRADHVRGARALRANREHRDWRLLLGEERSLYRCKRILERREHEHAALARLQRRGNESHLRRVLPAGTLQNVELCTRTLQRTNEQRLILRYALLGHRLRTLPRSRVDVLVRRGRVATNRPADEAVELCQYTATNGSQADPRGFLPLWSHERPQLARAALHNGFVHSKWQPRTLRCTARCQQRSQLQRCIELGWVDHCTLTLTRVQLRSSRTVSIPGPAHPTEVWTILQARGVEAVVQGRRMRSVRHASSASQRMLRPAPAIVRGRVRVAGTMRG